MPKTLAAVALATATVTLAACTADGSYSCRDLSQAEKFLKQPAKTGKPRLDPDIRAKLDAKLDELEDAGGCE